jgi:hypothetical protein
MTYLAHNHQKGLHQERELKVLSKPEKASSNIGEQPDPQVGY